MAAAYVAAVAPGSSSERTASASSAAMNGLGRNAVSRSPASPSAPSVNPDTKSTRRPGVRLAHPGGQLAPAHARHHDVGDEQRERRLRRDASASAPSPASRTWKPRSRKVPATISRTIGSSSATSTVWPVADPGARPRGPHRHWDVASGNEQTTRVPPRGPSSSAMCRRSARARRRRW